MKNPSVQLILSTIGVIGILAVGLFTVNCISNASPVGKLVDNLVPPCKNRNLQSDITIKSEFKTEKLIKPGETFEKTIEIKLAEEFKKQYSVNLDSLKTYFVLEVQANFTSDRCADLETYEISINFPAVGAVEEKDKCSFPEYIAVPAAPAGQKIAIFFNKEFPGPNPKAKEVLDKNFAENIKNNEIVTMTIKYTAKNEIPAGFGFDISLKSTLEYAVCD